MRNPLTSSYDVGLGHRIARSGHCLLHDMHDRCPGLTRYVVGRVGLGASQLCSFLAVRAVRASMWCACDVGKEVLGM